MFDQPTHLTRSYHSSRDTAPTRLYTLSLHDALPILTLSVSATTRPKRPGERDGVDYHFVTKQRFEAMVAAGELLEQDRKSTRLNSSHVAISYAVFCLKKKRIITLNQSIIDHCMISVL